MYLEETSSSDTKSIMFSVTVTGIFKKNMMLFILFFPPLFIPLCLFPPPLLCPPSAHVVHIH